MGRGQWGERITGTTIKDTWTKARERVGGSAGGGRWVPLGGRWREGETRQTTVIE